MSTSKKDRSPDQESTAVPAAARETLGGEIIDIVGRMAGEGLTGAQLKDLLQDAVESNPVQEIVGGAAVEADDEGYAVHVDTSNPLTRLAAACLVAEAADTLTHYYAREARQAGYTWDALAAAGGFRGNQNAWWKWEKNAKSWEGYVPGSAPAADVERDADEALPLTRAMTPEAEGWMPAAQLGRDLGHDPRTIRAMAARGEIEVLRRKGPSGRDRSLYRVRE